MEPEGIERYRQRHREFSERHDEFLKRHGITCGEEAWDFLNARYVPYDLSSGMTWSEALIGFEAGFEAGWDHAHEMFK